MGGISKRPVRIPRWLKRIERQEYARQSGWRGKLLYGSKPDIGLDEALRRSQRRLVVEGVFLALAGAVELIEAWLYSRGDQHGGFSGYLPLVPYLWLIFGNVVGSADRWIGAVMRRASRPGGVGREWPARQSVLRRWHWLRYVDSWLVVGAYLAIIPITHALYHPHPGEIRRIEVEMCTLSAAFLADAVYTGVAFRRINRRCFETVRADLLAAEAESAAGQADAEPSDAISWEIAG